MALGDTIRTGIAKVMTPRVLFGTSVAAALATWIMLLIGGTVNPTGSSLACDWSPRDLLFPTCNGAAFPEMTGGVLFEHGHRLWGWLVGVFTTATLLGAWARPEVHARTRLLALGALLLVLAQGALGGLTVVLGLNPIVSTAHLVTGYSFLSLMVVVTWRLAPSRSSDPTRGAELTRGWIAIAALVVLVQIVLGGVIRHFGAGLVCGADPIGCQGHGLWPSHHLQQLHMTHRFLGYTTALLVMAVALRAAPRARRAGRTAVSRLALVPIAIVLLQVTLGLLTIITGEVVAVAFHTAFGGLLLATMVALWAGFGALGERRAASGARPERVVGERREVAA
jgi:heme A synthase